MMFNCLIVEDNQRLRQALKAGLESTGKVKVIFDCDKGEQAIKFCLKNLSTSQETKTEVVLMDVQLAGDLNGIQTAMALRREFPRFPVVFYSIQDDDEYYRDFRRSGILSHYAYVRKSNYLLPEMIYPLLRDAIAGLSLIDPEIEERVQELQHKDKHSPMELLEPNEQIVARMLAQGMTNEQIAVKLGFQDKRTISRTNGQIYTTWGLNRTNTDEKTARTRAAIIVQYGRLISWDDDGNPQIMDHQGNWIPLENLGSYNKI
jgi:DNA-binding NarL/FixJ family response regulator